MMELSFEISVIVLPGPKFGVDESADADGEG